MNELESILLDKIFCSKQSNFELILNLDNTIDISKQNFYISHDTVSEFEQAKKQIQMVSYLCNSSREKLYEYMIKTYDFNGKLDIEYRKYVLLGMCFSGEMDKFDHDDQVNDEESFGCLVNDRWKQFLIHAKNMGLDDSFINDATFTGIYAQETLQYQNQLKNYK